MVFHIGKVENLREQDWKNSGAFKYPRYSLLCSEFTNSTKSEIKLFLLSPLIRKRNRATPWGILCCKVNT